MSDAQNLPSLFIGSSSEGLDIARAFQDEIASDCSPTRWDQGVFEPSGSTLISLVNRARQSDFAVLVATPDDVTTTRGNQRVSARDNIILEFGLFAGVIGLERTYLLAPQGLDIPSDLLGITRLPYHERLDGNELAAVSPAANQVRTQMRKLGRRVEHDPSGSDATAALRSEIERLTLDAESQGWKVTADNKTNLRLVSPRGTKHVLSKTKPMPTRERLRKFAKELKADGLRVNRAITGPIEESPY